VLSRISTESGSLRSRLAFLARYNGDNLVTSGTAMFIRSCVLLGLALLCVIICRMQSSLGYKARGVLCAAAVLLCALVWVLVDPFRVRDAPSEASSAPVSEAATVLPSKACAECHESRHASWQRSYHRTMTRDATPENVKADFNDAVYTYMGYTSRMYRLGGHFFIETIDPVWNAHMGLQGVPPRASAHSGQFE
jgi:hypothetical protein